MASFEMRTKENTLKFDCNKAQNFIFICGNIITKTFLTATLWTSKLSLNNYLVGSLINYAIQNTCISFHALEFLTGFVFPFLVSFTGRISLSVKS